MVILLWIVTTFMVVGTLGDAGTNRTSDDIRMFIPRFFDALKFGNIATHSGDDQRCVQQFNAMVDASARSELWAMSSKI